MSHPAAWDDADKALVARIRRGATTLRVRASLNSAKANTIADYLQEFADGLEDLMADTLTPAEEELERNERERDVDTKGRAEFTHYKREAP